MMKIKICIMVMLLAISLSACAMFEGKPVLRYQPIIRKETSSNIAISVKDIIDSRPDKGKGSIGNNYGYFIKVGEIKEPVDITKWISAAFKEELQNAGYNVLDESSIVLTGELLSVSVDSNMRTTGTLIVRIKLSKNNAVLFENTYKGVSDWVDPFEISYTKISEHALTLCLQDVIKQAMRDISKALR